MIYALSLYKKFQEKGKKMIIYNTTFHIHKDIVDEIEEKQVLTDELKDKIVAAAKEFIER